MLEFERGVDILAEVGGIKSLADARNLFDKRLDSTHLERLRGIRHEEALLRIANAIALCDPDRVFILTGSEDDRAAIRRMSIDKGEESALSMPGHTIHYDLPQEQGRLVNQTKILPVSRRVSEGILKVCDKKNMTVAESLAMWPTWTKPAGK